MAKKRKKEDLTNQLVKLSQAIRGEFNVNSEEDIKKDQYTEPCGCVWKDKKKINLCMKHTHMGDPYTFIPAIVPRVVESGENVIFQSGE
jgi:hypothetical protein